MGAASGPTRAGRCREGQVQHIPTQQEQSSQVGLVNDLSSMGEHNLPSKYDVLFRNAALETLLAVDSNESIQTALKSLELRNTISDTTICLFDAAAGLIADGLLEQAHRIKPSDAAQGAQPCADPQQTVRIRRHEISIDGRRAVIL